MTRVGVISDEFWAVVEPLMPSHEGKQQSRGIATRYDKYALTYLGSVLLACAVIHARVGTPKLGDTP